MKKQYTKKQIQEAIAYWKKQLNENQTRPTELKLNVRLDNGFGVDDLYETETVADLGINPRMCSVNVIFDGDPDPHPVYDGALRPHPNFDGNVLVLKLDEDDPLDYADFYDAAKDAAGNDNLAFVVDDGDGNLYPSYEIRISGTDKTLAQFDIMVRR